MATMKDLLGAMIDEINEAQKGDNGVSSWNDLTDKPFYDARIIGEKVITFDGNTEGKETFQFIGGDMPAHIKISDDAPSREFFNNADNVFTMFMREGEQETTESFSVSLWTEYMGVFGSGEIIGYFFTVEDTVFQGIPLSKGTWFMGGEFPDNFYAEIRFSDIVSGELKSIDEKYLTNTAGRNVSGQTLDVYDFQTGTYIPTVAGFGAEIFNDYVHNVATGEYSHAEGMGTMASGMFSHAEGNNTCASGQGSHAEGCGTTASGYGSHAEGYQSAATGIYSHAEGKSTASGEYSHAEVRSTASGDYSHAEGCDTVASGGYSHAEGRDTVASKPAAHAEGSDTTASEYYAHAEGQGTIASGSRQHVQGRYNIENSTYAHIVGNGSKDTASNAHTLDWNGNAWYKGSVTSNGADYAEYFEWLDGNPDNKDLVGLIVTLDGEKIKLANVGDEILGVVSSTAAVLGDNYECEWNGKYLTDDFGRVQYEEVEEFHDAIIGFDEETRKPITEKKSLGFFKHPILNPNYDPEQTYVNRANRPEWATIGMLGKLYVRDDGTCEVNGYATVGTDGVATVSTAKTNMRVLSRVNDNIVRVLLK